MCGLCGFVYKDAARTGSVGRVLHGMLVPMGRRGTDSTGIALQDSATVPLEYERALKAGVGIAKKMIST